MSVSDELQRFYGLECSRCKQPFRTLNKRNFDCTTYERTTSLVPRCLFHVDLTDESGSTTATIAGDIGERLLGMTADEIYEITGAKMKLLPIKHVQEGLANKLFRVQLKKSACTNSETMKANLWVLSYAEQEHNFVSASNERSKKTKAVNKNDNQTEGGTEKSESSSTMMKLKAKAIE